MGNDQILLETKRHIDAVGDALADRYEDAYYDKGRQAIYHRTAGIFSFLSMGLGFTMMVVLLGMYWMIVSMSCDGFYSSCARTWYPLDTLSGLLFAAGVSILLGFVFHPTDSKIDYIRLSSMSNGGTRILIKVYDSSGRRNIDEDYITEIKEAIPK